MDLIKVSTNLTGKMEGMVCITTSMTNNEHCKELSQCDGSICSHCYSKKALSYRPNVRSCYEKNGDILKSSIIPENQLPFINASYCRFESHGDLHNITHLQNYINITLKNPHCQFALWTKQYEIIKEYFKNHPQPDNLNIIISSYLLNKPINVSSFEALGIRVKSFTVYDKNEAVNVDINCGKKKCINCLQCYDKNSEVNVINEKIK